MSIPRQIAALEAAARDFHCEIDQELADSIAAIVEDCDHDMDDGHDISLAGRSVRYVKCRICKQFYRDNGNPDHPDTAESAQKAYY